MNLTEKQRGFSEGSRSGARHGYRRAVKELAKLEADPESVARLRARLNLAEDIVDWIGLHFDNEREQHKRLPLNDHIASHVREQQRMRT